MAAVVAVVAGLVLWKFDPARMRRLAGAVSNPVTFVQNGGHAAGRDRTSALARGLNPPAAIEQSVGKSQSGETAK